MSALEVLQRYKQRWQIETLFRDSKQKYEFGKVQNRIFEASICFLTISLVRYAIITYIERKSNDYSITGSVFEHLKSEIEDMNKIECFQKFGQIFKTIAEKASMSISDTFINSFEKILDIVRTSIVNLLFQGCET